MFVIVKKVMDILTKQERWQLFRLFLAVVCVGFVEVAGIASIMPFMAVVGNPEVIEKNQYLSWAYQTFEFTSTSHFLVALGLVVFGVIVLTNCIKSLALWLELNFVHLRLYSISRRLLFRYLSQPYAFFLNQNTADLGKNILQEVSLFAHHVLRPFVQILSRVVIVCCIFSLLLFVDPLLAVVISVVLGGMYLILFVFIQRKVKRLGKGRFEANILRTQAASEAFGGIKELKVLGRERFFVDLFSINAYQLEKNYVISFLIGQLPSYIMEVFAFGGILLIVLYFLMVRQDVAQTLPVMVLYAFAGYRLMPALQGIFSAVTLLRFNVAVLDTIHQDLSGVKKIPRKWQQQPVVELPFEKQIQLKDIVFTYPSAEKSVLQGLNLIIQKNTSVGFVGGTGSGKTTTIDLLLGLLSPQKGQLLVDDIPISDENLRQWQQNVGYIAQAIFLSDNTLAANIAFGVPSKDIDMTRVKQAARVANIHEFVVQELPQGYNTVVGEDGVRLSGGQKQRIGIARALYHDPEVLVMDEATSALDSVTETAVMQAIRNLAGRKTILIIAHRLTTLQDCDIIYILENGQVLEHGTYDALFSSSSKFRKLANVSEK